MENNYEKYDTIIIGAGPAGLTAAIYLARNNVNVLVIESYMPGGKLAEQSEISNYPGFSKISGSDLATSFYKQAKDNDVKFLFDKVISLEKTKDVFLITLGSSKILQSKYVIIATGMQNLVPSEIINIDTFNHKGVSYCAICDGPVYKDKVCGIIGGGNSAFEESLFLASIASKVYIFVRDKIIAEKKIVDAVYKNKKIKVLLNSTIKKLEGTNFLQKAIVNVDGQEQTFELSALFPYIGFKPATSFIKDKSLLNERGFIIVDENMETKIPNLFATGDVIVKSIRQITTATNDGTIAAKIINTRIS